MESSSLWGPDTTRLGLDQLPSAWSLGGPPIMPPSTKRVEVEVKHSDILMAVDGLMALRST